MSENVSKCPCCGAELPPGPKAGPCPRCAAQFLQATQTEALGEPSGPRPRFTPPPASELASLFPQLEILELVGQGGMGAVYKARQKELDRIVALKVLPPDIGHAVSFAERFAREAKALARLNHPAIVTLYEFGRASGDTSRGTAHSEPLYFFLMEFVNGVNLRQVLEAGRMSAREALAIVPQICDALQYAHDQGIVHRDIKPENILLDRQGHVKVADFGLAKLVGSGEAPGGEAAAPSPASTGAGTVMGTPQYMAPEQRERPTEVDHRADIYSLGVVFYQMLTGELPAAGKVEAPSRKVILDVRLDEVVLRTLERQPERRYQQASRVKEDVETIAGSSPSPASTPAPDPQAKAQWRRHYHVKAACLFFGAVCFLIAATSFFTREQNAVAGVLSLVAVYGFSIAGYRYFQAALTLGQTDGTPAYRPPAEPQPPAGLATAQRDPVHRKVRDEAVGLLVIGVLNWILIPLAVVAIHRHMPLGWTGVELHFSDRALNAISVASLALSGFLIYAAVKMMRLEAYRTAVAGCIVAMLVPPGNFFGLPLGIWAVVILTRPDVRAAFRPAREPWFIPKWAMFLALGLLGAYAIKLGERVFGLSEHAGSHPGFLVPGRGGVTSTNSPINGQRLAEPAAAGLGADPYPMHTAARQGEQQAVSAYLEMGSPVDSRGAEGQTVLHLAAARGHQALAGFLLAKGAEINATDKHGRTPLHLAAAYGHRNLAAFLLEKGAAIDATDQHRRTPLAEAIANCLDDITTLLAGKGANPALAGRGLAGEDGAAPALALSLKIQTLPAFEKECQEPGVLLDSPHVCFFAPKRKETEARIVFPYLVKAYDELHRLTGVHTYNKLVVYAFPAGNTNVTGGTSGPDSIEYDESNLDLAGQEEWKEYRVPHVSGIIEEMAHCFVTATHAKFGWEMLGWSLGVEACSKVANNPRFARNVVLTRQEQGKTFERYLAAGCRFPDDVPGNLCDRIHAWILYDCSRKYGPSFWPDFYSQVGLQRDALFATVRQPDNDAARNARYQITIGCFDQLPGLQFSERLKKAGISLTTDVKSFKPEAPGWNRRLGP